MKRAVSGSSGDSADVPFCSKETRRVNQQGQTSSKEPRRHNIEEIQGRCRRSKQGTGD